MDRLRPLDFFQEMYPPLTGNPSAFPWQKELFLRLCTGNAPKSLNLPTGCGKTSAMSLWLLALSYQAQDGPKGVLLPRRLVWVVNRRVVVDQATREAVTLRARLQNPDLEALEPVRAALRDLATIGAEDLLGISTLRGQFADNAEWRNDPARPAVIVGTVDMIGSRMLFSGYGRGFKSRPLHAGYLGQDSLLVHDEAHLEPAFQELLTAVEEEQQHRDFKPVRVMALTATARHAGSDEVGLSEGDLRPGSEISKRVGAVKRLGFHFVDDEKRLGDEVFQRALTYKDSGQAIVVFLRTVKDVSAVSEKLASHRLQTQRLTGTLRGYERDRLATKDAIFARFLRKPEAEPASGTVYLVCTAAGEVGVDMSADHLVCDLTPFDSMAQRLGRVNRFGDGEAQVDIVCRSAAVEATGKKKPEQLQFEQACRLTLELLQELPQGPDGRHDGSPAALAALPAEKRQLAFTPPPGILSVSGILFDAWAMTSVREKLPGRPPVADWLHGFSEEWEPPQTYVAWRTEVDELKEAELREIYEPEDLLEDYSLKPHELLRDTTQRVTQELETIAKRHPHEEVWIVETDGTVQVRLLSDLVGPEGAGKQPPDLSDCTVILPPEVGGLLRGMLDGRAEHNEAAHGPYDVADQWFDEQAGSHRLRVWDEAKRPAGMRLVRTVDTALPSDEDIADEVEETNKRRYWRWYVRMREADDDGSRTALKEQELVPHCECAQRLAVRLAFKLNLGQGEAEAVERAAAWHDLGKNRAVWQRSIGNRGYPERVLAKSGMNVSGRITTPYRHEFGSLADIAGLDEFLRLNADTQDLVLHLVASHHGRGRPHFSTDEAFDQEGAAQELMEIAKEVPRRYARLQRKYGRWGLAYLESLVRSCDALASQGLTPAELEEGRKGVRA